MITRKQRNNLNTICRQPISAFRSLGDVTDTPHGPMIHIDNGGSVLAVAHLDTVSSANPKWVGDYRIQTPDLDDRLGVWVLLDLLPSLGVKGYDVLLCDSEEVGNSTAQYFPQTDSYNWLFEFDRAGMDVVTYQYGDSHWDGTLASYGFDVSYGAFSDISYLEHLGVKAVNVGVGYHQQHTSKCHADLRLTVANAMRFVEFYNDNRHTIFPHNVEYQKTTIDWYDDEYFCPWCYSKCTVDEVFDDACPTCRQPVDWDEWLDFHELSEIQL